MLLASAALVGITVAAFALAYYFAVGLPRDNRERLAFDRMRYEAEQRQRKEDAESASRRDLQREAQLDGCLADAESKRMNYLKLNGTPGKAGTITNSEPIVRSADERKRADVDSCFRRFGK